MERAVILLSGGLDSTTCLAYARNRGLECYALSFDYGQRHVAELNAARKIAVSMEVAEHKIFQFAARDLLKGSALTDESVSVPDYRGSTNIPVTYVPARNTVFLAMALGWAEALGADSIFIGVSSVDYSGYPDCRPEFIKAFQDLIQVATKVGVEGRPITIETPLIHLSKEETIKMGAALGVDYSLTVSCYQTTDDGLACGRCDSCHLRRKGFMEAGVKDPTRYVSG